VRVSSRCALTPQLPTKIAAGPEVRVRSFKVQTQTNADAQHSAAISALYDREYQALMDDCAEVMRKQESKEIIGIR
jgi:hypothetical protein